MFKVFAAATGAALLALAPLSATAQQPDQGENSPELCVYYTVSDDEAVAIGKQYVSPSPAGQVVSDAALKRTKAACGVKHGIADADALDVIAELGVYGLAADYLADQLAGMGASEEALDAVFDFYETLADEDYDVLYDTEWRDNTVFVTRMKAGLVTAGLPNNDQAMALGLEIIDVIAMSDLASFDLMMVDLGGGASGNGDQATP